MYKVGEHHVGDEPAVGVHLQFASGHIQSAGGDMRCGVSKKTVGIVSSEEILESVKIESFGSAEADYEVVVEAFVGIFLFSDGKRFASARYV